MGASRKINAFRKDLAEGRLEEVRKELSNLALSGHSAHESCLELGEICEEAGLFELARREYEAALGANPEDRRALFLLVDLCASKGDTDRLLRHLMAAFERMPTDGEILSRLVPELRVRGLTNRVAQVLQRAERNGADPDLLHSLRDSLEPPEEEAPPLLPPEGDLIRFMDAFGGREDVHARQWHDSLRGTGFTPVHQPLTLHLLKNHVLGNVTLGVYPIRLDGTVSFFALDLDIRKDALENHRADGEALVSFRESLLKETHWWRKRLEDLGFDPLVEDSGYKGRHLWVLLGEPIQASRIHYLGKALLAAAPEPPFPITVEFFPRQGRLRGKGLGNLIKLPLGIHRRTGRRSCFLGKENEKIAEPWDRLRKTRRATESTIEEALLSLEKQLPPGVLAGSPSRSEGSLESHPTPSRELPGPSPASEPVPWTEASFEADPEVNHLLKNCSVLAALKEKACRGEGLNYQEQIVLRHTLGHLQNGVSAFNYLLRLCGEVQPDQLLVSRLRGSPPSCEKIRKRLPGLTSRLPCNCKFDFAPNRYPSPLLHLSTLEEEEDPGRPREDDPERIGRIYTSLVLREEKIREEREAVEKSLIRILRSSQGFKLALEEGDFLLKRESDGRERIEWKPRNLSVPEKEERDRPTARGPD